MLIEFSVENFRSIRERMTLSMIAAKLRAHDEQLDRDNVVEVNAKLALLRSVILYGANASGKSNLIEAASFMRGFVLNSAHLQEDEPIPTEPFRLDVSGPTSPSTFEIVFLIDGKQYRYGFSLTTQRVLAEWLYYIPTLREKELFTRDEEEIHVGRDFPEGRGLRELNLENKLFLSVVAQFNKKSLIARPIRDWLIHSCHTLTAVNDRGYRPYTMDCIEKGRYREQIEHLVNRLDLDIVGLSVEEVPLPAPSDRTHKELRTTHAVRDQQGQIVKKEVFPADHMESEGTQKLIALTGPLVDVLTNGWVLFLDEIDSRLHPLITAAILRLFNSPKTNPKNAQIICTTHDTNLLDRHLFRRDQIYFVEKDDKAASHLYSLAEFKLETPNGTASSVRNDASFEKDYIQGRYGAIPYLGDLNRLFIEEVAK